MPVNIMLLGAECCYAECYSRLMSFMLTVTNRPFMQSVVMLNVIALTVIVLNDVAPICRQSKFNAVIVSSFENKNLWHRTLPYKNDKFGILTRRDHL
jgi:hypothetical protein